MSKLEKYIIKNKQEFDSLGPRAESWDQIQTALEKGRQNDYSWLWKVAAILLFGVSLFLLVDRSKQNDVSLNQQQVGEFSATEEYFEDMIIQVSATVESYTDIDDKLKEEFRNDVFDLSQQYKELKAEYEVSNQQQVRDALISNLQLRIALLNNQLMILKDIDNLSKNNEIHI